MESPLKHINIPHLSEKDDERKPLETPQFTNQSLSQDLKAKLTYLKNKFKIVTSEGQQAKTEVRDNHQSFIDMKIQEVEKFKESLIQYDRNKRALNMQLKVEKKNWEHQQQREASKLIHQLRKEKHQRMEMQRQKAESILEKQLEAMTEASSRLTHIKQGQLDISDVVDQKTQYKPPVQYKDNNQTRFQHNLLQQKLRWKPKVPLYLELEQQFKKKEQKSELQVRHQLYEIKQKHRPVEISEIRQHMREYDEMLKERAQKLNRSVFTSPHRRASIEPKQDPNADLDIVVEEGGSENKKKKQRQHYQQLASIEYPRSKSRFERDQSAKREQGERRNNYSKYVKELNLPLELDRKAVRKEASRLRLQQQSQKQTIINNLVNDGSPIKEAPPQGRNNNYLRVEMSQDKKSLPPIINNHAYGVNISPSQKQKIAHDMTFQTPQKTAAGHNWASDFLKNSDQSISRKEKVDFILSKANELEEEALRMQKKIQIKNKQLKGTVDVNKKAQEIIFQQQEAGDKLVDAIRAKLALLNEI